ncbi:mtg1 [Candida oxycetoniae]|uniref:Mtg1 n=1 Tax=Candida oxycetoniae TaxID=497107 RepID=A0AAI9SVP2_9ASCO|nr:mtg1 [Candida oxycetoniae]KAI3403792.2 mtg1 [Candida oxycetoniae]
MSTKFIPRTVFPNYNVTLSNFKGHHQKALTKLGHLSPQLDLVLEVRDCRAPVATTNVLFDKLLAMKRKLVLYSKKDLSILKPSILDRWHKSNNEEYMLVDCRSLGDCKRIVDKMIQMYQSMDPKPPLGLRSVIVGMPNVGKSTLVNTMRSVGLKNSSYEGKENNENNENNGEPISTKIRKVAKTGGQPGVTRSTSEIIRLSRDPELMVYDTPGVFLPTVKNAETMLALGLVGCVHNSFIDPVILADYLLFVLNLQDPSGKAYNLYMSHPTNDIYELMYNIAKQRKTLKRDGSYDELGIATHWLNLWKQAKTSKYKCLFDLPAILKVNEKEYAQIQNQEKERIDHTNVHQRIVDSFGSDGSSKLAHRKRTAKDRMADMKNRLFKL